MLFKDVSSIMMRDFQERRKIAEKYIFVKGMRSCCKKTQMARIQAIGENIVYYLAELF
ncbi:MAG: hypothetical protein GY799_15770 [Desulfobulbaceae bacterium]|nr:hypothetical protein [Desulfobulbaceae bacterium]